jgi:Ankyrin repeats (3 copies)
MQISPISLDEPHLDWPGLAGHTAQFHLAAAVLALALFAAGANTRAAAQTAAQHKSSLNAPNPETSSLDARDAHGLTPLIVAASSGNTATIKSLLAQGAGIDATAADGRTALIAAVQSGRIEAVQALIAADANLNWSARGSGTALNVAENSGHAQIAALLLQDGAQSTGKSVGDTVCVRPWAGDGFCGKVTSFSMESVAIQVTKIVGCGGGCQAREECSAGKTVGGSNGVQTGDQIAVPSWCLTQTGVKP